MISGRLSSLSGPLGARHRGADAAFAGVTTDSRRVRAGELFVALRGERFDGHDHVLSAARAGASGALVERYVAGGPGQLVVGDSRGALGDLARLWRRRFEVPVIGITGSNGKTTVKEMLTGILRARGPVLATEGNLNNDIGLPLTVCRLSDAHRAAVLEMGANHAGEIAYLAGVALPAVGVVTNAGAAHLEGFGSPEGVARAKGELFQSLPDDGCAVINADDRFAPLWREMARGCRRLEFGFGAGAAVRACDREAGELDGDRLGTRFRLVTPAGEAPVALPLPGAHNVMNALAAGAAAHALGLDPETIRAGLEVVRPVSARLQVLRAAGGARVIDDTYNANPSSLQAGLEVLRSMHGRHWLVLGDMAELGQDAVLLHRQAGDQARAAGVERLYTLGALAGEACVAFGREGERFESPDLLVTALRGALAEDVSVLVKGSRTMRMERVVAALCGDGTGAAGGTR